MGLVPVPRCRLRVLRPCSTTAEGVSQDRGGEDGVQECSIVKISGAVSDLGSFECKGAQGGG